MNQMQAEALRDLDLRYTIEPDPDGQRFHVLDTLMHKTALTFGGALVLEYANRAMYDLNTAEDAGEQPTVDWLPIARRSNGQEV